MTEKRFCMNKGLYSFEDTGTGKTYSEYNLDEIVELLNELHEKNRTLLQNNGKMEEEIECLSEENEQLKQRNDRQAKRLDNLYRLIEEKDWRTLSDILDDFKRCEEQLQRESGTYCDVE